ncbi:MAG: DNA recombination protein RmuC [Actinomycetota bacterium]
MDLGPVSVAAAIVIAAVVLARVVAPVRELREMAARQAVEAEATRTIQARLDLAAGSLSELVGKFEERGRLEEAATEAVTRIERLVTGSSARGRAGENLLSAALGEFPQEMVIRDFRLGGRVCEFALRLPDEKVLAVDSKWAGLDLIDRLEASEDPAVREELRRQVEQLACSRIKEVAGYIEPSVTAPLAVMAVPDSVYACCRKAHRMAQDRRVIIVSYSLALPLLLGLWNLYRGYARSVDHEQLLVRIHEVSVCLRELGDRIEGRLARGLTIAGNALGEMRGLVADARACVAAIEREGSESRTVPGGRPAGIELPVSEAAFLRGQRANLESDPAADG